MFLLGKNHTSSNPKNIGLLDSVSSNNFVGKSKPFPNIFSLLAIGFNSGLVFRSEAGFGLLSRQVISAYFVLASRGGRTSRKS